MPWKRLSALAAALVLTGTLATTALAQRWDRDDDRRDRDWRDGDRRDGDRRDGDRRDGDRRDGDRRDGDRQDRGGDRREWVLLGERKVNFGSDRDVINVEMAEDWWANRGFRRLHLIPERSDIHLMSVRLVFMNGYSENFDVDRLVQEGQDHAIDLRGEMKYLRRIELFYRSRPGSERRAIMKVYGALARFRPNPPGGPWRDQGAEWIEFGCKRVSLVGVDRDTIDIGRDEGRFKAVRLKVHGADIHLLDLTVVYANGTRDTLEVRSRLRQGDRTGALELRGRERSIGRIEMTYVTVPNFRGQATVCAEGLQ